MDLGLAIMMKDEAERIVLSLETVKEHIEHYYIEDTGSIDDSVQIVKTWCKEHDKILHIEEHDWVDFSHNRNILLDMCRKSKVKFILLLDANEKVENLEALVNFLKNKEYTNEVAFKCTYKIFNDAQIEGNNKIFTRCNVIRNTNYPKIEFRLPVHEYLHIDYDDGKFIQSNTLVSDEKFFIYQDRMDDKPSSDRAVNDIKALKKHLDLETTSNTDKIRCCKYLCQTYRQDYKNIYDYAMKGIQIYNLLNTMRNCFMFDSDIFNFTLYLGRASFNLGYSDFQKHYISAYEFCLPIFRNAFVLYELCDLMLRKGRVLDAYNIIQQCCDIPKPDKNLTIVLPINFEIYDKHRYVLRNKIIKVIKTIKE